MPLYMVEAIQDIRNIVRLAWPEVVVNGIYHATQIASISFENKAEAGGLPVAAFEYNPTPSADWGASNLVDVGILTVYYIDKDTLSLDNLIRKLELLRTKFIEASYPNAVSLPHPQIAFGHTLPLWDYFLRTQRPYVTGAVLVKWLVGEGLV